MAIASVGTTLKIESATPATFTTIGEVVESNGPSSSMTVLDPTNLADTRRRKALGLMDPGEMTVTLHLNYGDAGQDRARTQYEAKARANFQLVIPAGSYGSGSSSTETTLAFAGYITRYSAAQAGVDGLIRSTMTITLDSAVTES